MISQKIQGGLPENGNSLSQILKGQEKKRGNHIVFLIEDDIDDQVQILGILKSSPYIRDVHCFENSDGLIAHIAVECRYGAGLIHNQPALILLDLHLPGKNGIEILQQLKDHPLTEDIPVIIITNDLSQEWAAEAYRLKATAYLTKPLCLESIHKLIQTDWEAVKKWVWHRIKTSES